MEASRTSPRRRSAVAALAFCLLAPFAGAQQLPPPTFGETTARETDEDQTVEVFLSMPRALNVTFTMHVTSRPVTANRFVDYEPVDTLVTFVAGRRTASFFVTIRGDNYPEPDETFALTLEGGETVLFTIEDDDEPNSFPDMIIDDAAVFEGAGETSVMRFRVSLSEPAPRGTRVDYATDSWSATEGEDFAPVRGTLFFEPGQVLAWIDVPIFDDLENEEFGEWLVVDLTNPVRANFPSGISRSAFGAIRDDDVFRGRYLFARDATGVEGGTAVFRLELSSPSDKAISLRWASGEPEIGTVSAVGRRGVDYAGLLERITFLPGETVKEIAIPLHQDTEVEGDEYFALNFEVSAEGLAERTFPAQGVILDDDQPWSWPQLRVNDMRVVETSGWMETQVALSLARAAETEARVTVELREGTAKLFSDVAPRTVEVIFAPGQLTQTVRLSIGGDAVREPLEHFTLHFRDPQGLTIVKDEVTVAIVDDDGPPRPRAVRH